MLYLKKSHLYLLIVFAFLRKTEERKTRKAKVHQPPVLTEYPATDYLPSDSQVTTFLRQGENKTYFYWSTINNSQLSITLITCSSPINWSIGYRNSNFTTEDYRSDYSKHTRYATDIDTYTFWSSKGLYIIRLYTEKSSFAHLYISTAVEFPQEALQEPRHHDIKLIKRRRRKRLTVRWDPSLIDPHVTDYCLVVNTKQNYKSLCSAQTESVNTSSFHSEKSPTADPQVLQYYEQKESSKPEQMAPKIVCVGEKTHFTLSNLQQGQDYYFNVFATNKQTNLTYPHGSAFIKFDRHIKPTLLKDGKLTFVNIKKLDGKAVFTYKLSKKENSPLEFYVVPCGGGVDVEVTSKNDIFKSRKRIKGFGKIVVKEPQSGMRYQLRVVSVNPYELARTSGIKVLATTKPSKVPFPMLPSETLVHEYISLRKCNSITVGWHSTPDKNEARYCVTVKKGRIPDMSDYKVTDHCINDQNLKSMADISYCKDIKHKKGEIITQQIDNLKPDENYIVYITVKKRKGRSLSYDILQSHTKLECD